MKCITILLILSLIHYCLGCYSTNVIKQDNEIRDKLKEQEKSESVGNKKGLFIKKTNGARYYLIPKMYKVEKDTLYAKAQRIVVFDRQEAAPIKIALNDILQVEIGKPVDAGSSTPPVKRKDAIRTYLDQGNRIYVIDLDSSKYFFNTGAYQVVNDTLQGEGQRVIDNFRQDPEQLNIAINNILKLIKTGNETIERGDQPPNVPKFDAYASGVLVFGLIVLVIGIYELATLSFF